MFAFHPHQDRFTVAAADVVTVDGVDGRVATLFPLVETALQVTLDAGSRMDEPVVVLGLGPVGVLAAALIQRSGADVIGADPRGDRRETAATFGIRALDTSEIRAAVAASTSGAGVPLVVDATGARPPCRSLSSSWRTRERRWSAAGTGPRRCGCRSAEPSIGAGSRSGARRSRRSPHGSPGGGTFRAGEGPRDD